MFVFKRESLFPYREINRLDHIDSEKIDEYMAVLNNIKRIKYLLDKELKFFSKNCYENGEGEKLKQTMKIRRKLKKNESLTIPKFFSIDLLYRIEEFNQLLIEKTLITQYVKKSFDKNNYSFFLQNHYFQKALKYTNPKAYDQIFDEEKFNKTKYKKTRYSYIQRNILKANSLSWMGVTSFKTVNSNTKKEEIKQVNVLNQYVVTSLLFLAANDEELNSEMNFHINEFALRKNIKCYIQKIFYTSINNPSFMIRENILFKKNIVDVLYELKTKNFKHGKQIKNYLIEQEISFEFLLKNNLILPDFKYYSTIKNITDLLSMSNNLKPISIQLHSSTHSDNTNLIYLSNEERTNLNTLDNYYFEQSLVNIIEDNPMWINSVGKYEEKNFELITSMNDVNYHEVKNCVRVNDKYHRIVSIIKKCANNKKTNFLDLFLIIEGELVYRENFWKSNEEYMDTAKIEHKKSYMIMFQKNKMNEPIFTNIYPGNGFLLGREFPKMNNEHITLVDTHLKNIYGQNANIFEVVVDNEVSSITNCGNSPYKKLYWPDDFSKVQVAYEDGVKFFYEGTEIAPVYFGSIPIHFFHGAKGLFLNLISPWCMGNEIPKILDNINKPTKIRLNKEKLNGYLTDDFVQQYINILIFFKKEKLPLKFFIRKLGTIINNKPIFITLLNIDAYRIFMNELHKGELEITFLNPEPKEYSSSKLYEYINIITDEEINNYVEKLSYIQR